MSKISPFLHNGPERYERAQVSQIEQVCAEVEAEFAEQLASATWWQRIRLRRIIRQEIVRRLPPRPSTKSLYAAK